MFMYAAFFASLTRAAALMFRSIWVTLTRPMCPSVLANHSLEEKPKVFEKYKTADLAVLKSSK